MNNRRRAALFAAVFTMGLMGSALSASADTLAEAMASAYETNPGIRIARATLRNADETYFQQRRTTVFPTVSVSFFGGSGTRSISSQTNCTLYDSDGTCIRSASGTTSSQRLTGPSISLNQTVYDGGRLNIRIKNAEIALLRARESLRQAEAALTQQVVTQYLAVLAAQEELAIAQESIKATRQNYLDTQAKAEIGTITMTSVATTQASLASSEAALAQQTASLENARLQYRNIIGREPVDLQPPPPLDALLPKSPGEALDFAKANNNTIRGAYLDERAQALSLAQAKSSRRPSVSTNLSVNYTPEAFQQRTSNTQLTTGVTLNWPLGNPLTTGSTVRQAEENFRTNAIQLEQAQGNLQQQVNASWNSLQASRNRIPSLELAANAANLSFVGKREEVGVGLATAQDLLLEEQRLRSAEQSLVSGKYDLYRNGVSLLLTMGALDPTDIAPQLEKYDPMPHYENLNTFSLPWEGGLRALDSIGAVRIETRTPAPGEIVPVFEEIRER